MFTRLLGWRLQSKCAKPKRVIPRRAPRNAIGIRLDAPWMAKSEITHLPSLSSHQFGFDTHTHRNFQRWRAQVIVITRLSSPQLYVSTANRWFNLQGLATPMTPSKSPLSSPATRSPRRFLVSTRNSHTQFLAMKNRSSDTRD